MNLSVVVTAKFILLISSPTANGLGNIAIGILAADHEANLPRWIGWNGSICVLNGWENLLAVLLQLGDQWKMEPLVFSCI